MASSGKDCGWHRGKLTCFLIFFQVLFIVLFGVFIEYDDGASAHHKENCTQSKQEDSPVRKYYAMFQDVHVMMFVGFGFLMTFLKRYGFGSVGINFLIAAFVIQWATLMSGFLHLKDNSYAVGLVDLITSDFAAACVLISFGAVLGKTSPLQLIVMAFIEIVVFTLNEYIGLQIFQAVDAGGSMFVHVFGAYFGIAAARMIYTEDIEKSKKEGSIYHSDIFAMIGTVFLWIFWPSFNSALLSGEEQHRAIINTYFALAACCVTSFAVSAIVCREKFDMVHVQNATLAGGVAVGTSADMMIYPFGAMIIGTLAGILSVVGYKYVTPFIAKKARFHDTCGVNNLHGMPGVLAAIVGAVVSSLASVDGYGDSLHNVFPARAPIDNSTCASGDGKGRGASWQAAYQIFALLVTLVISIVSGLFTGLLLRLPLFEPESGTDLFSDKRHWELPDDFIDDDAEETPNGNVERDPSSVKVELEADEPVDNTNL